jgi:hypothetical protein
MFGHTERSPVHSHPYFSEQKADLRSASPPPKHHPSESILLGICATKKKVESRSMR